MSGKRLSGYPVARTPKYAPNVALRSRRLELGWVTFRQGTQVRGPASSDEQDAHEGGYQHTASFHEHLTPYSRAGFRQAVLCTDRDDGAAAAGTSRIAARLSVT
jgi:hypothetical protein